MTNEVEPAGPQMICQAGECTRASQEYLRGKKDAFHQVAGEIAFGVASFDKDNPAYDALVVLLEGLERRYRTDAGEAHEQLSALKEDQ